MENILITGSEGQLGKSLAKEFMQNVNVNVNLCDIHNKSYRNYEIMDITDIKRCREIFYKFKPTIVIHCAAQTKVDILESEFKNMYDINIMGTKNIALLSNEVSARVIHISTDYVFDGFKNTPYLENDIPNPLNYYGITKLESERIVLNESSDNIVLRTSWMYGDGHNFIKTIANSANKKSILKVVNDQIGTPTSSEAVAKAILFIIDKIADGGIYHATCEGETTWYDLAKKTLEILKLSTNIVPVSSEQYNLIAKRPSYSVLENTKLKKLGYELPYWETEADRYIESLNLL